MNKNIFIIILTFLVVGLIGFITYDSFFKPNTKCNVKETTKEVTKEKTADERYKEYLDNLTKSIKKTYVDPNEGEENVLSAELNNITYVEKTIIDSYSISITKDLILTVGDQKLSDKAVSYYNVHTGNGDFNTLFFITTEGKVYKANYESEKYNQKVAEVTEITGVKNIIEVKDGSSTAGVPLFVDIDGNIFTLNAE